MQSLRVRVVTAIVVRHASGHNEWPLEATHYVVTATFTDGTTRVTTGELGSPPQTAPITVNFNAANQNQLPAGGTVQAEMLNPFITVAALIVGFAQMVFLFNLAWSLFNGKESGGKGSGTDAGSTTGAKESKSPAPAASSSSGTGSSTGSKAAGS